MNDFLMAQLMELLINPAEPFADAYLTSAMQPPLIKGDFFISTNISPTFLPLTFFGLSFGGAYSFKNGLKIGTRVDYHYPVGLLVLENSASSFGLPFSISFTSQIWSAQLHVAVPYKSTYLWAGIAYSNFSLLLSFVPPFEVAEGIELSRLNLSQYNFFITAGLIFGIEGKSSTCVLVGYDPFKFKIISKLERRGAYISYGVAFYPESYIVVNPYVYFRITF